MNEKMQVYVQVSIQNIQDNLHCIFILFTNLWNNFLTKYRYINIFCIVKLNENLELNF